MAEEVSIIAEVVQSLGRSVELALEASAQTTVALEQMSDTFVFYRLAFGESQSSLVGEASEQVQAASDAAQGALQALSAGSGAVQELIVAIAPGITLTPNPYLKSEPSGEEIPDASLRRRSVDALSTDLFIASEDIASVVNFANESAHGVFDIFHPPDPGSLPALSPVPSSATPPPQPAIVGGDPVLTGIVTVALVARGVRYTVSRLVKIITGGTDS